MNLDQVIDFLQNDRQLNQCINHWRTFPARDAKYVDFPEAVDRRLVSILAGKGVTRLYTHQGEAVESIMAGHNVVVVTPTASGKTLCYNLPVLNEILRSPGSRALYLFPTKALSQDQLAELHDVVQTLKVDIKTYTFDGDTPTTARRAIRSAGHIVVTNPDMLHHKPFLPSDK